MRNLKANLLVLAFVAALIFLHQFAPNCNAGPIKWKALSSWSTDYTNTKYFLIPWVEKINEKLKGKLEVTWVGPEAVPPFEQIKPLKVGVFDVLATHSAYHAGAVAVGMGMDLFSASSKERRAAGFYRLVDEVYRKKVNAHYLGAGCDGTGYHLMLRNTCIKRADLSGLKIRTSPFYDPFITSLKGATVRVPGGEVYSALEKGVVDGACWPAFGAFNYKWYEVAKWQVRPRFGETVHPLLVNVDSWNKLSPDLQKQVTEITLEVEEESRAKLMAAWQAEEQELVKLGMKLCVLPPDQAEKYLDTFYTATWNMVIKLDKENGPKLKELADFFFRERVKK